MTEKFFPSINEPQKKIPIPNRSIKQRTSLGLSRNEKNFPQKRVPNFRSFFSLKTETQRVIALIRHFQASTLFFDTEAISGDREFFSLVK